MDCSLPGSSVYGDSPGKNTGVGCYSLLQGIFPTQGSNPSLAHCRQFFYCLSHQGSPFHYISSVQLLSHVWLFSTLWTTACQASLSITNSWSLPKLMSIESVMPSKHLILCHLLLLLPSIFPSIRVFSNESVLIGLTSLQSKGLSRIFSNTIVQKH